MFNSAVHRNRFLRILLCAAFLWCEIPARAEVTEVPDLVEDTNDTEPPQPGRRKRVKRGEEDLESVGEDVKQFGEMVADRVDKIIKKKGFDFMGHPWSFQGIPIIFPANSGMNLGISVLFQDISREDPHEMEINAQMLASDLGRYKHHLKLDFPHAFGEKFRLITRFAYDRDFLFNYFGVGNNTTYDPDKLKYQDPLYQTVRAGPSFTVSLLRKFDKNWRLGPLLGFKWTDVTSPAGSQLDLDNPIGKTGGNTHYLGLGVVYSTLDFEPYPTKGVEHEWYNYYYTSLVGSQFNFGRSTYTFRHYIPLQERMVLAHRSMLEGFIGEPPFYEMQAVAGTLAHPNFGGDRFLRGYPNNQFVDKVKFVASWELRWDIFHFEFYRQTVTFGLVPFIDIGRVWQSLLPVDLGGWHLSGGTGVRFSWNRRFIIKADFSMTPTSSLFHVDIGHTF